MKKVAIHSVPRSGSTWLGQIFNSHPDVAYRYQPLFSYAFKDRLNDHSTMEEIRKFFEELSLSQDKFLLQIEEGSLSNKYPVFEKNLPPTHVVYKEVRYHHIVENLLKQDNEILVIGLVRNPMAVMHSWLKSPREFRRDLGWDVMEEWRSGASKNAGKIEEFYGFDKWKETTAKFLQFQHEFPKNFMLLKYNDLLTSLDETVAQMFAFTALEMKPSTERFLVESRSSDDKETYGVYKSHTSDDSWKGKLDSRIVAAIEKELSDTPLEPFLN